MKQRHKKPKPTSPSHQQRRRHPNTNYSSPPPASSQQSSSSSINPQKLQEKLEQALQLENSLASLTSTSTPNKTPSSSREKNNNTNYVSTKQQKTIMSLCEIFSDILLANPTFAYQKDIPNKLWRTCFYNRINTLRSHVQKDKHRLRRFQLKLHQLQKQVEETHLEEEEDKKEAIKRQIQEYENRVQSSNKDLSTFLKEAVLLYNYLIEQLQGKLVNEVVENTQNDDSDEKEDDRDDDSDATTDDEEVEKLNSQISAIAKSKSKSNCNNNNNKNHQETFIVPTLFKLYIHLGDLHRYLTVYISAEKAYLTASYLAPGKGNPYNQLAVCAQLSQQDESTGNSTKNGGSTSTTTGHPLPAVALYWYCRSLLAPHEKCEISASNLDVLFASNKKYIDQQQKQEQKKQEELSKKQDAWNTNQKSFIEVVTGNPTTNANGGNDIHDREKSRIVKSMAKRNFLSRFVDFHGKLISILKKQQQQQQQQQANGSNNKEIPDNRNDNEEHIVQWSKEIHDLVKQFASIMSLSSFGDAFLIKMIVINSFSVYNSLHSKIKNKTDKQQEKEGCEGDSDNKGIMMVTKMMDITKEVVFPSWISVTFMIQFGTQLSHDLIKALEKGIMKYEQKLEQQQDGRKKKINFGSLRLLGPLFITCEFISNVCNLDHMKQMLVEYEQRSAPIGTVPNAGDVGANDKDDKGNDGKNSLVETFESNVNDFWSVIANVANVIKNSPLLMNLIDIDVNKMLEIEKKNRHPMNQSKMATVTSSSVLLPDDLKSLIRGYTPFLSFDAHDNHPPHTDSNIFERPVYVSPEEAVGVLDLDLSQNNTKTTQLSQSSQRSKKSTTSTVGSSIGDHKTPERIEGELKVKLERFMSFVDKHLESGELIKTKNSESDDFGEIIKAAHEMKKGSDMIEVDNNDSTQEDDCAAMDTDDDDRVAAIETQPHLSNISEEKKQGVLVYTSAGVGKPALLIPGALLLSANEDEEREEGANENNLTMLSSDVRMAGTEGKQNHLEVVSTTSLLNPSLLLDNSPKNAFKSSVETEESKLLPLINKPVTACTTDVQTLQPPPMLPTAQQNTGTVRPPPGFHTVEKPLTNASMATPSMTTPSLPPSINGALQMPPGINGALSMPPKSSPSSFQYQLGGFGLSTGNPIPQTANPFMHHDYIEQRNTVYNRTLPNHYNNYQNPGDLWSSASAATATATASPNNHTVGNTFSNINKDDESSAMDFDILNSIGIFSNETNETEEQRQSHDFLFQSSSRTYQETHNPFVFD